MLLIGTTVRIRERENKIRELPKLIYVKNVAMIKFYSLF